MVTAFLKTIVPAQSFELISDYVTYVLSRQSIGLFLAGLIMSITASSAAFPQSVVHLGGDLQYRRPSGASGICSPLCSSRCCCWCWCMCPLIVVLTELVFPVVPQPVLYAALPPT